MESKMLDFPLPFRPVIELKLSSLQSVSVYHNSPALNTLFTILKSPFARHTT
jgi:hypothetical protein